MIASPSDPAPEPPVAWCISDGKPGHRNQVRGLIQAIRAMQPVTTIDIDVRSQWNMWFQCFMRRFPPGSGLASPHLILGAGHVTHPAVLAAQRAFGGRSVILMKPTVPARWFDLCIIPEHDGIPESDHVIVTRGAINLVTPRTGPDDATGMILLGGPSAHHEWHTDRVVEQVRTIVTGRSELAWTLTTSRRTPAAALEALHTARLTGLSIVTSDRTETGWLPLRLSRAREAWVTEDSVSMIYEALTSGASVGLIELSRIGSSRVTRGLDDMIARAMVTPMHAWRPPDPLPAPSEVLHESRRCAQLLRDRGILPCPPN